MALWSNEYHQEMSNSAYEFNQSIVIDIRLFDADLRGSMAHAQMLGKQHIIESDEAKQLVAELSSMREEYANQTLQIDLNEEDIHSFIEAELTRRLGDIGKKIHSGRSRNDQVALDIRLTLRKEIGKIEEKIKELIGVICSKAEENEDTIMPGYTHLQRAQPITFGHHLMAYANMLLRDLGRLSDTASAPLPRGVSFIRPAASESRPRSRSSMLA